MTRKLPGIARDICLFVVEFMGCGCKHLGCLSILMESGLLSGKGGVVDINVTFVLVDLCIDKMVILSVVVNVSNHA